MARGRERLEEKPTFEFVVPPSPCVFAVDGLIRAAGDVRCRVPGVQVSCAGGVLADQLGEYSGACPDADAGHLDQDL